MPDDPAALDYDEIEAAVLETARGRWFLREFAHRNRSADTSLVLDAIGRLESAVGTVAASWGPKPAPPSPNAARVADLGDVVERLQEAAWSLRSSGARPSLCDEIERWTDEIVRLSRRQHVLAEALATSDAAPSRGGSHRPEEADQIVFVEPAGMTQPTMALSSVAPAPEAAPKTAAIEAPPPRSSC